MIYLFLGVTRIGREDAPVPQDITIEGPGIEAEHCLIINEGTSTFMFYVLKKIERKKE